MDAKEEWFCPRCHETCQALVELEYAQSRVAELEEWRKEAVNRILDLKSKVSHLTNDNASLQQGIKTLRSGIDSAIGIFDEDDIDAVDCCELLRREIEKAAREASNTH